MPPIPEPARNPVHIDIDWLHLAGAIPYMLVLGVVMSFSPTTYGITVHTLVRDADAVRAVSWIACGVAAASTLLVLIFTPLNPTELIENFKGQVDRWLLQSWIDITAGVLLLCSGAWLWGNRHKHRSKKPKRVREMSAGYAFVLGFINTLAGTSGIATMYVTGRVLAGVSSSFLVQIPVYCVFLVGLLGPYALMLLVWNRYPKIADFLTESFDRVSAFDFKPVIAILVLAAGLVFLWLGLR